ncbi:SDR family oxidoreductase [uncultured Chryseobacterium sp.]|uniref:SDR family oxidoreductase n=1 Tax=uncultured Chryseobacterium sp. TaxID=259322 RepID=UPI002588CB00|nr:SDR family oxidoreductase [uncultured Chryseobacterium sp.]
MKTLENKKVIILGGSSGLGLATAQAAAADGAEVIIVSSNQQRIDRALATLPENSRGFAVSLDKEENIKTFFSTIGKFDHLVYTAGENISMSMVDDTDIENGKDFFTIRFWGAFAAIKYGRPQINEGGSINLMSGNFGQRPAAGYSLGATICGAMDAFTKAMAVELVPVRVNNIAAGIIDTNLWGNLSREDKENFFSHLENTLLLQRVGQPMDVADAFVFLMKQEYMTGQSLVIDGGAVLV